MRTLIALAVIMTGGIKQHFLLIDLGIVKIRQPISKSVYKAFHDVLYCNNGSAHIHTGFSFTTLTLNASSMENMLMSLQSFHANTTGLKVYIWENPCLLAGHTPDRTCPVKVVADTLKKVVKKNTVRDNVFIDIYGALVRSGVIK